MHSLVSLLRDVSERMIRNSIWTVTRAVNSRVSRFVRNRVSRAQEKPIFEMLPPQRITLRDNGLLGSGHRAVVVSLPTSSGKTFIAQFRMLQALNQFDADRGWVAYIAPTRALVNQVCARLRRDFAPLGIVVERLSPALEIDGVEAQLLSETEDANAFRVIVTTPEKLDMLLRGGWEAKIGRPLTLVVVDEAHNLSGDERGLRPGVSWRGLSRSQSLKFSTRCRQRALSHQMSYNVVEVVDEGRLSAKLARNRQSPSGPISDGEITVHNGASGVNGNCQCWADLRLRITSLHAIRPPQPMIPAIPTSPLRRACCVSGFQKPQPPISSVSLRAGPPCFIEELRLFS
ncbi:DEAD/DEAH box helicase [Rhizobium mongolense]|uniref:DEAD/DEAH box helicase n=1 Tax=Rhizobium mongolense TaxID=57676 RepID=UPI0035577F24